MLWNGRQTGGRLKPELRLINNVYCDRLELISRFGQEHIFYFRGGEEKDASVKSGKREGRNLRKKYARRDIWRLREQTKRKGSR